MRADQSPTPSSGDRTAEPPTSPERPRSPERRSVTTVTARVQQTPTVSRAVTVARRRYGGSAAQELVERLKGMQFVTTLTVFGATFLLSALPFMILVSSFANRHIEDDLASHLGLDAHAAAVLERLFVLTSTPSTSAVVLALVLTAAGTVGIAGIVQTVYRRIFEVGRSGGNLWRLLLWTGGLCVWLALDSIVADATDHLPAGRVVDGIATLVVSTAFFWWSMHLLLAGQVAWRRLLLPAAVSAVCWLGLEVFAALYFSSTIANDSRLYGSVGVVFSMLTWFMAIAAVVILGALLGHMWQERHPRSSAPPGGESPDSEESGQPLPADAQ